MLTDKMRPVVLGDVDGQPHAVNVLSKFASNPKAAYKCLLLHGPYGTGKTSAARAFAHAVNNITQPKEDVNYVWEFNCASLVYEADRENRSIEKHLEELIDYPPNVWEVVILDEIQGASELIQTGMLKFIERKHDNRFFVFCTTDLNGVIDTLRSRCLPIEFKSIRYNDVYKNLKKHVTDEGLDISNSAIEHIAVRCNGHMRDAHIELVACITVGAESYLANATSHYGLIADMFIAAHKGDKDSLVKYLRELSFNPLFTVKKEFENFIIDCGNTKYTGEMSHISEVNRLLDEYGDDFTDIVDFYTGIWDNSLFGSDRHFYMHMLSFYKDMERKRA
jgi:DNA polymerase III delta prime subunit